MGRTTQGAKRSSGGAKRAKDLRNGGGAGVRAVAGEAFDGDDAGGGSHSDRGGEVLPAAEAGDAERQDGPEALSLAEDDVLQGAANRSGGLA